MRNKVILVSWRGGLVHSCERMEVGKRFSKRLDGFLSSRWTVLALAVFSFISLPLGVCFYFQAQKERALTYYPYPLKTIVLRAGYAERLRVFHKDQELTADVSAVQVAIWNEGKEPILGGNVLEQIEIVTNPPVQILEATVPKQTRKIVSFSADSPVDRKGIVRVSWRVLEQRDGAIVQVIYAGPPDIEIGLRGVILGQKRLNKLELSEKEYVAHYRQIGATLDTWLWVIISLFYIAVFVWMLKSSQITKPFVIGAAFGLAFYVWILFKNIYDLWTFVAPPFAV